MALGGPEQDVLQDTSQEGTGLLCCLVLSGDTTPGVLLAGAEGLGTGPGKSLLGTGEAP